MVVTGCIIKIDTVAYAEVPGREQLLACGPPALRHVGRRVRYASPSLYAPPLWRHQFATPRSGDMGEQCRRHPCERLGFFGPKNGPQNDSAGCGVDCLLFMRHANSSNESVVQ